MVGILAGTMSVRSMVCPLIATTREVSDNLTPPRGGSGGEAHIVS